jgi:hypothetical protein
VKQAMLNKLTALFRTAIKPVCQLAEIVGVSVSSVETIIYVELKLVHVGVPKQLSDEQDKFKFHYSSWTVLKGEVTHFCIQ